MKQISKKELLDAVRTGKIDAQKPTQNNPFILSKRPASEIDDREPMERMADELEQLSMSMQKMTEEQAKGVIKVLGVLTTAVEILINSKQQTPEAPVTDKKPNKWKFSVTKRDKNGFIDTITADTI